MPILHATYLDDIVMTCRYPLLVCALIGITAPALAQSPSDRVAGFLGRLHDAARSQVDEIRQRALQAYEGATRSGSCAQRRDDLLKILPDALVYATYSRDIYTISHDNDLMASGRSSASYGNGVFAYRDGDVGRYAELHVDTARRKAVVVFRGTRVSERSDIGTDVANFFGADTVYYTWAAALVGRVIHDHPGYAVVATGQSLGGGLVINAVLRNPGATGFAFNPAGLPLMTWETASHADRARVNRDVTVFTTRNDRQIEPISALSFAGRSAIPGHIYVVYSPEVNERSLHGAAAIVSALEQIRATGAAGDVCNGDIGLLAQ